jgi:hypothetical protein
VRLIDDEEPARGGEVRQYVVTEVGVVEPLGGDEQDVHLAAPDLLVDLFPLDGVA